MGTKVPKEALKSLVKECLLEILAEGLMSQAPGQESARLSTKKSAKNPPQEMPIQERLSRAAKRASTALTNDPTLQAIIEDTAHTTFQDQMEADRPATMAQLAAGRMTTAPVAAPTVEDGDSRWARLAFTPKKK